MTRRRPRITFDCERDRRPRHLPVVAGVENDIDEIEDDVFDGSPHVSRRIYELAREVIDLGPN